VKEISRKNNKEKKETKKNKHPHTHTSTVEFILDQNELKHDEALKEISRKDPLVCKKIAVGTPIHAEKAQAYDNTHAGVCLCFFVYFVYLSSFKTAKFKAPLLMLVAMADTTVNPASSVQGKKQTNIQKKKKPKIN
jgi:hypothetical protein